VVHSRVYKTDHTANLNSAILVNDAEHNRETRGNEAGKCEGSGNRSAVQGTRSQNETAVYEERGTSLPGNEWSTSRTEEYAVRGG